jgi:hypothetical protein
LFHALPLLLFLCQFGFYWLLPVSKKLAITEAGTIEDYINILPWGHSVLVCIIAGYAVVTFSSFIRRFKQDPDLGMWLKLVSTAFLVFALSNVVYSILFELIVIPPAYDYFIVFFMTLFICLVTYFAFMYSNVFNGISLDKH